MYSSQTTSIVNDLRAKSPTKADTDHHNGDLKNVTFSFSDSDCYQGVFNNSQSSLNYSLNYLINFNTFESGSWSFCCGWNQNVAVLLLSDP